MSTSSEIIEYRTLSRPHGQGQCGAAALIQAPDGMRLYRIVITDSDFNFMGLPVLTHMGRPQGQKDFPLVQFGSFDQFYNETVAYIGRYVAENTETDEKLAEYEGQVLEFLGKF